MLKTIAMALLALIFFYRLLLVSLSYSQSEKPLPADVKDIFDARDYQRFLAYADDKRKLAVIKDSFEAVLEELLLGFDVFAKLASVLPAASDLNQLFFVLILTAASFLLDLPFSVFEEMGIEKKYGFSQTSKKTFLADEIKEFIITMILSLGCISLVWLFYYLTGPYLVLCAFGTLIVFVLAMSSGSMRFMKLFNKFTPLPEGELKKRLTAMFTSYGYQLKDIYVMDASKRTSRSNAFCTGLGKFKSIALYDNLLHTLSEDEIVATI
jgi:STE24 endopeptidase